MDGQAAGTKRKATPDLNPPRKRRRRVQEDLRVKVLRKTVREFGEGQKTKKRKLDRTDDESASSSVTQVGK